MSVMAVETVFPGSPDVRRTDPVTSHEARDRAVKSVKVARLIEAAFERAGHPMVADEVHRVIVQEVGVLVTPERVRTVLKENDGLAWERLDETGVSHRGNRAHLWALREDA